MVSPTLPYRKSLALDRAESRSALNHQIGNWHEATLDILFRNLPEKRSSRWGETITAEKMSECRWVKPKLVCQVAFVEWTDAGHLRHCTFNAMRGDKKAGEVVRET